MRQVQVLLRLRERHDHWWGGDRKSSKYLYHCYGLCICLTMYGQPVWSHLKCVIFHAVHSINSLGQGTPAFIANALSRPFLPPVEDFPFHHVEQLNRTIPDHPVEDRRTSDMVFFPQLAGYDRFQDKAISHQPIHDAKSIFWVIVFFMVRANPKGSDIHKNISSHSESFDAIVGHEIGIHMSSRESHFMYSPAMGWADMLPEKLVGFSGILHQLWSYFSFPWHGIKVPDEHQFHGHNLLQRLLIQKIRRLSEKMKDPIELELVPLPIHSSLTGTQHIDTLNSLCLLSQLKRSQTEDGNEAPPAKRPKCGKHKQQAQNGNVHLYVHFVTKQP